MVYQASVARGTVWLPRFHAEIPVSLYINGRQIPPIETQGEITRLTSTCLQIRCENKISIPSRGIIRFALDNTGDELALNVDFVRRVEITPSSWFWKIKPTYEMQAVLQGNASQSEMRYKQLVHQMIFEEHGDSNS
jgi:hypothetical protein